MFRMNSRRGKQRLMLKLRPRDNRRKQRRYRRTEQAQGQVFTEQ